MLRKSDFDVLEPGVAADLPTASFRDENLSLLDFYRHHKPCKVLLLSIPDMSPVIEPLDCMLLMFVSGGFDMERNPCHGLDIR